MPFSYQEYYYVRGMMPVYRYFMAVFVSLLVLLLFNVPCCSKVVEKYFFFSSQVLSSPIFLLLPSCTRSPISDPGSQNSSSPPAPLHSGTHL